MEAGKCFHLINGFICSEGQYQNYPCPYRGEYSCCSKFINVTKEMAEQYKTKGYVRVSLPYENH